MYSDEKNDLREFRVPINVVQSLEFLVHEMIDIFLGLLFILGGGIFIKQGFVNVRAVSVGGAVDVLILLHAGSLALLNVEVLDISHMSVLDEGLSGIL